MSGFVDVIYVPPALMAMRNAFVEAFRVPKRDDMRDLIDKLNSVA